MNPANVLIFEELVHVIGWTLLHSLWEGAIIGLLAFAVLSTMKRSSSSHRYMVSSIALFTIPVMAVMTFFILESRSPGAVTGNGSPGMMSTAFNDIIKSVGTSDAIQDMSIKERLLGAIDGGMPWIVAFWLTGLILLVSRQLGGLIYIHRISKKHSQSVPEHIMKMADRIALRMNYLKPVSVLESLKVRVPMAMGYLKPVVILPLGIAGSVPYAQIESILVHELAHIYRRDYIVNILQSVIEAIFFFNPATWWLSGNIRRERENACDDITMQYIKDPIIYIKALTHMKDRNSLQQSLVPALAGSKKDLLERIKRMTGLPTRHHRFPGYMIPAMILVSGIALIISNTAFTIDRDTAANFNQAFHDKVLVAEAIPPVTGERSISLIPRTAEDEPAGQGNDAFPQAIPDTTADQELKQKEKAAMEEARAKAEVAREKLDQARKEMQQAREEYFRVYRQHQELNRDDLEKLSREVYKNVIVIMDGDSMIVRQDSVVIPHGLYMWDRDPDSSLRFEYFEEVPDLEDEAFRYEMQQAHREMERVQHEMQERQVDMERIGRERQFRQERMPRPEPNVRPRHFEWTMNNPDKTERIIRQELLEDGLVDGHKSYVIEIKGNGMYVNGEKQSRDTFRKYKNLYEGLEDEELDSGNSYRLVF